MGEFRVVPSSLDGAAGRLASSGARIGEAGASLGATSGAGPATGDGEAAAVDGTLHDPNEAPLGISRFAGDYEWGSEGDAFVDAAYEVERHWRTRR